MKKIPLPVAIGLVVVALGLLAFVLWNRESATAYSSAVSQEIKPDLTAPTAPGPQNIIGRGGGPRSPAIPASSGTSGTSGDEATP